MDNTTTLYIARDGRIACCDDCPPVGSDAFFEGDYRLLTQDESAAIARELGGPVECHGCKAARMHRAVSKSTEALREALFQDALASRPLDPARVAELGRLLGCSAESVALDILAEARGLG